ncbi:colicin D domain-containing protein [Vibrio sp. T11.5]|uniref:colicin D domain-containing protein n=1 Tax=Vibrio sp. T11.5 TaxID=2998836 RepID=UPI0022CD9DD8|nr:colicin D domain-containing protein [Vibrio sp. T11.5]MDA0119045.1 hypothetical protein [Vibrio sp. T11.5]
MKLNKIIIAIFVLFTSYTHAVELEVVLKDVSNDHYHFYVKLVEDSHQPTGVMPPQAESSISAATNSEKIRYLSVWKESPHWKVALFDSENIHLYKDYIRLSSNNKLDQSAVHYSEQGTSLTIELGSYQFKIRDYLTEPVVTQTLKEVKSDLIHNAFSYPYASYSKLSAVTELDSYVTKHGTAGLSMPIFHNNGTAHLSFIENRYTLEGLDKLKSDKQVSIKTTDDLTTIDVDHGQSITTYFLKSQLWVDHNSGVLKADGSGWSKPPFNEYYLSSIGQCVKLKTSSEPSCYPIVSLNYGRQASLDSLPHLVGWKDQYRSVQHQFNDIGSKSVITDSEVSNGASVISERFTYSDESSRSGQPPLMTEKETINSVNNIREVTRYLIKDGFVGLVSRITRFGTINGTESPLSETKIDWNPSASGDVQKTKVVDSVSGVDGSVHEQTVTNYSYDAKGRIEKRLQTTENFKLGKIEEQVVYEYSKNKIKGKKEHLSIASPAYESGQSALQVKDVEYKYKKNKLTQKTVRQGSSQTQDIVEMDSHDRLTSRVRKMNNHFILREKLVYQGERLVKHIGKDASKDYQYLNTDWGSIVTTAVNGTPLGETHYDPNNRAIAVVISGKTEDLQFYSIDKVPAELKNWQQACPADTTQVSYNPLQKSLTCITTRGEYQIRMGLDGRLNITHDEQNQSASPHSLLNRLDRHIRDYEANKQSEERLNIDLQLKKTYANWGNTHNRYYDITGLLYRMDDDQGNTVRFTYNIQGQQTSIEINGKPETKITFTYDGLGKRTDSATGSTGVASSSVASTAATPVANNVSLDKQRLKQLKKKFKHAVDFGVKGNCNSKNLKQFDQAIRDHIIAPGTQEIDGSYRGEKVQLHTDPATGLTVILEPDGKFLSGWKLNPKQLECVLNTGKL